MRGDFSPLVPLGSAHSYSILFNREVTRGIQELNYWCGRLKIFVNSFSTCYPSFLGCPRHLTCPYQLDVTMLAAVKIDIFSQIPCQLKRMHYVALMWRYLSWCHLADEDKIGWPEQTKRIDDVLKWIDKDFW